MLVGLNICIRNNDLSYLKTVCIRETETECSNFIRIYTVFKGKKDLLTKEYHISFEKYNLAHLDIYNGLSQVYCIKPEGRIH